MKFFQLTRNERLGLIGVLVIFLVIILFKHFDAQVTVDYRPSSIEYKKEPVPSVRQTFERRKESIGFDEMRKVIHIAPFEKFNPNRVDAEYWKKIGFENKLAIRLQKFIQSGIGIKEKGDLTKVYGMKKEWFECIKDSIILEKLHIDINTASAESFEAINGIGEKISHRIIKFRNSLGGFYSIQQLKKVYGIDSNIIAKNYDIFNVNAVRNKMNVNTLGLKKLVDHPFINLQQGEEIIKIRSVYGEIDSLALKDIFTLKEWSELKHYLKWEN
ncbi:MAG: hypothetical protein CMP63_07450 [Flavobacteriales bacterium]|nr:hypothetical protein [Flavobacteriales bacterium]|tara:strand:- start:909 stop:1724 length:816 start_codon:yes stop_codon:yes gene_type:complete